MTRYYCSCGFIINENNEILLEDHIKNGCLSLPGGKIDLGESPLKTLKRELKEELNIDVEEAEELGTLGYANIEYPIHSDKFCEFNMSVFKVLKYTGTIINNEPDKHKSLIWLSKTEAIDHNHLSGMVKDMINLYL